MQSSTQQAGSKELLQHMDGTQEDLFDAVQQLRSQEENHLACMRAWLWEDQQKDKVLHQQMEKVEEAVAQQEERYLLARRRGFCCWLQQQRLTEQPSVRPCRAPRSRLAARSCCSTWTGLRRISLMLCSSSAARRKTTLLA
ncbi:uncharacterized protein AAGF69_005683 [Amazona ochrocephala]